MASPDFTTTKHGASSTADEEEDQIRPGVTPLPSTSPLAQDLGALNIEGAAERIAAGTDDVPVMRSSEADEAAIPDYVLRDARRKLFSSREFWHLDESERQDAMVRLMPGWLSRPYSMRQAYLEDMRQKYSPTFHWIPFVGGAVEYARNLSGYIAGRERVTANRFVASANNFAAGALLTVADDMLPQLLPGGSARFSHPITSRLYTAIEDYAAKKGMSPTVAIKRLAERFGAEADASAAQGERTAQLYEREFGVGLGRTTKGIIDTSGDFVNLMADIATIGLLATAMGPAAFPYYSYAQARPQGRDDAAVAAVHAAVFLQPAFSLIRGSGMMQRVLRGAAVGTGVHYMDRLGGAVEDRIWDAYEAARSSGFLPEGAPTRDDVAAGPHGAWASFFPEPRSLLEQDLSKGIWHTDSAAKDILLFAAAGAVPLHARPRAPAWIERRAESIQNWMNRWSSLEQQLALKPTGNPKTDSAIIERASAEAKQLGFDFGGMTLEQMQQTFAQHNTVLRRALQDGISVRDAWRLELRKEMQRINEQDRPTDEFLQRFEMSIAEPIVRSWAAAHPQYPEQAGWALLNFGAVPKAYSGERRVRYTQLPVEQTGRRALKAEHVEDLAYPQFDLRYPERFPEWIASWETLKPGQGEPRVFDSSRFAEANIPVESNGFLSGTPLFVREGRLYVPLPNGNVMTFGPPLNNVERMARIKSVLSPAEIQKASTFYSDWRPLFERFGPGLSDHLFTLWVTAQANASPEMAFRQVMTFAAREYGIDPKLIDPPKTFHGERDAYDPYSGKILMDTMAKPFKEVLSGYARQDSAGIALKLWDFLDANYGKQRRSWAGGDPRAGAPFVIDVWNLRAGGYTDPAIIGKIQAQWERAAKHAEKSGDAEAAAQARRIVGYLERIASTKPDSVGAPETEQYMAATKRGMLFADFARETGALLGRHDVPNHVVQAIEWEAIKRLLGERPTKSAQETFEMFRGELYDALRAKWTRGDAPLERRLPEAWRALVFSSHNERSDLTYRDAVRGISSEAGRLAGEVIDEVARVVIPGVHTRHRDAVGAWTFEQQLSGEPSAVIEIYGQTRPSELRAFAAAEGLIKNQLSTIAFRRLPPGAGKKHGNARVYEWEFAEPYPVEALSRMLSTAGVGGWTAVPTADGSGVRALYVLTAAQKPAGSRHPQDPTNPQNEGKAVWNADKAAVKLVKLLEADGITPKEVVDGWAEQIGARSYGDSRDHARARYAALISKSGNRALEALAREVEAEVGRAGVRGGETFPARASKFLDLTRGPARGVRPLFEEVYDQRAPLDPRVEAKRLRLQREFALSNRDVLPDHEIPVVPVLREKRRGATLGKVLIEGTPYDTHPTLFRELGYRDARGFTAVVERAFKDRRTGEYYTPTQAMEKFGKSEMTEFSVAPAKRGVAQYRQEEAAALQGTLTARAPRPTFELPDMLRVYASGNATTPVHEFFHHAVRLLPPSMQRQAFLAAGAKDPARPTVADHERLTRSLERALNEGRLLNDPRIQPLHDTLISQLRTHWVRDRDYFADSLRLPSGFIREMNRLLMPDVPSLPEIREIGHAESGRQLRMNFVGPMAEAAKTLQVAIDSMRYPDPERAAVLYKYADNLNLERLDGPAGFQNALQSISESIRNESRSRLRPRKWHEVEALVEEMGLTANEFRRGIAQHKGARLWDDATIDAARTIDARLFSEQQALANHLARKIAREGPGAVSDAEFFNLLERTYARQAFHEHLSAQKTEVARALAVMRKMKRLQYDGTRPEEVASEIARLNDAYTNGRISRAEFISALSMADKAQAAIASRKMTSPTWSGAAVEALVSGLLGGLSSTARNLIGNAGFAAWRVPELEIAGVVGEGMRVYRRLRGRDASDLPAIGDGVAYTYGMVRGGQAALRMAMQQLVQDEMLNMAARTGVGRAAGVGELIAQHEGTRPPTWLRGVEPELSAEKIQRPPGQISGQLPGLPAGLRKPMDVLGAAARVPFTVLQAGDAPFKVVAYAGTLAKLAYRQARQELGLVKALSSAPDFHRRVEHWMKNPTPEMVREAREQARYMTFTNEPGPLAKGIMAGQQGIARYAEGGHGYGTKAQQRLSQAIGHGLSRMLIPFVRVVSNLTSAGFERGPLAPIATPGRFWGGLASGGAPTAEVIARMVTGTAVFMAFAHLAAIGRVTGTGPSDPDKRDTWMRIYQPLSFKMWDPATRQDVWVSYLPLEPGMMSAGLGAAVGENPEGRKAMDTIANWIGLTADYAEMMSGVDPFLAEERELIDDLAMPLLSATSQIIRSKLFWASASRWMEAVTDPARSMKSAVNNAQSMLVPRMLSQFRYIDDPFLRDLDPQIVDARARLDAWRNRLAATSRSLPPKRDDWGAPIQTGGVMGPEGVSPFWVKPVELDPVRREAARLGITRAPIPWKNQQTGGVKLDPWTRDYAIRVSGERAYAIMAKIVADEQRVNPARQAGGGRVRAALAEHPEMMERGLGIRDKDLLWSEMNEHEQRRVMARVLDEQRARIMDSLRATLQAQGHGDKVLEHELRRYGQ